MTKMALKYELDTIDDLDESVKSFYEKDEESGKYRLSLEDGPEDKSRELTKLQESIAALEAKNQEILSERAKAKKKAEEAAREAARKAGDVESLEKSWQEKLNAVSSEKDETIKSYEKTIYDLTVKTAASQLASKLALQGSADVLLPHIERRLQVENKEGKALIRVLDEKGNLSANSLADLEKEILSTKAFAPILQGPKSSGTGVQTEGRKTSTSGMKRSEMSAQQKAEFINEHGQAEFLKIPK
jgi:chromosome segregation ATPase